MTDPRPLIAYRYSVPDINRWPDAVVQIFANHLRTKDENVEQVALVQQRVADLFADITGLPVAKSLISAELDVQGYSLTYMTEFGQTTVRNTWRSLTDQPNHLRTRETSNDR